MKLCTTCGNEIEDRTWKCPFCEHPQHQSPSRAKRRTRARDRVVTVNIKEGGPTVEEALAHLQRELTSCRHLGTRVIRLIHGYGSGGTGGRIRTAVRKELAGRMQGYGIREVVHGEDYSLFSEAGRRLRADHPELKAELRTDRENPGITFIVLG